MLSFAFFFGFAFDTIRTYTIRYFFQLVFGSKMFKSVQKCTQKTLNVLGLLLKLRKMQDKSRLPRKVFKSILKPVLNLHQNLKTKHLNDHH